MLHLKVSLITQSFSGQKLFAIAVILGKQELHHLFSEGFLFREARRSSSGLCGKTTDFFPVSYVF